MDLTSDGSFDDGLRLCLLAEEEHMVVFHAWVGLDFGLDRLELECTYCRSSIEAYKAFNTNPSVYRPGHSHVHVHPKMRSGAG